jgi:uracil-DNA glycosylase
VPEVRPLIIWDRINRDIAACEACPRLREHCAEVAERKRAAYRHEVYWGRPVENFGHPSARLLILGLAPGAHGANRTGRMFTGDRSGNFLFCAMFETGFASQAGSSNREDGLHLIDAAITAAAHCAPPGNKPEPGELAACRGFLDRTVEAMPAIRDGRGGVLALGQIAFGAALELYVRRGWLMEGVRPRPKFGHGVVHELGRGPFLMGSYHPSQQNTFTGKLTQEMLRGVFVKARERLDRKRQME